MLVISYFCGFIRADQNLIVGKVHVLIFMKLKSYILVPYDEFKFSEDLIFYLNGVAEKEQSIFRFCIIYNEDTVIYNDFFL
jgi:hypothetical protein